MSHSPKPVFSLLTQDLNKLRGYPQTPHLPEYLRSGHTSKFLGFIRKSDLNFRIVTLLSINMLTGDYSGKRQDSLYHWP